MEVLVTHEAADAVFAVPQAALAEGELFAKGAGQRLVLLAAFALGLVLMVMVTSAVTLYLPGGHLPLRLGDD